MSCQTSQNVPIISICKNWVHVMTFCLNVLPEALPAGQELRSAIINRVEYAWYRRQYFWQMQDLEMKRRAFRHKKNSTDMCRCLEHLPRSYHCRLGTPPPPTHTHTPTQPRTHAHARNLRHANLMPAQLGNGKMATMNRQNTRKLWLTTKNISILSLLTSCFWWSCSDGDYISWEDQNFRWPSCLTTGNWKIGITGRGGQFPQCPSWFFCFSFFILLQVMISDSYIDSCFEVSFARFHLCHGCPKVSRFF